MSILYSGDSEITQWPLSDLHDRLSNKYYYIDYRPDTWQADTPYIKGLDLVIPTVNNGCMYECISGGRSSVVPPIFTTKEGGVVDDQDVKWRTLTYSAKLGYNDIITSSTWSAPQDVLISDEELILAKSTAVKVMYVPLSLTSFELVNTINITRSTGRLEVFKKTLLITVGVL